MTHRQERLLRIGSLARVEGEGALHVRVDGDTVTTARLEIYEPPRFFEAFLRGRAYTEPPDITARVCGICPVAYQMSACRAIEDACGVLVDGQLAELRRLLYCGEWIESHVLHIYLLHAPDFLGYGGVVDMARDHRAVVERGLALKKVGNDLMELLAGRAIHPVNVRLGGFYRVPTRAELAPIAERLRHARDAALATVRWVSDFDFPDARVSLPMLALDDEYRYPIDTGDVLVTTEGRAFPVSAFERHVVETQVPHSTALYASLDGAPYLTGPLARYNTAGTRLSPIAAEAARAAGLGPICRNPYQSIVVRAVEALYAIDEALRIIDEYRRPARPFVPVEPRAASGYGATEAPRGLLYHRYDLAADGTVTAARIVPPTSQNQAAIEVDLRELVQGNLDLDDAHLTAHCEEAIRNYDPCISCSAHFLDLTVERT
jgi:coenzyme F420-reducing hydrogenase alpha subunit